MKTVRELLEELEDLVDHHGMWVMDYPVMLEPGSRPPDVKYGQMTSSAVVIYTDWLKR